MASDRRAGHSTWSPPGRKAYEAHDCRVTDGAQAGARTELQAALHVMGELSSVVLEGPVVYRASSDRRQRVRYLWIVVGGRLKNYCEMMGIARAGGDLAGAIGFRHVLAYGMPDSIDDEIVWSTSIEDLPRLITVVRETLNALGD